MKYNGRYSIYTNESKIKNIDKVVITWDTEKIGSITQYHSWGNTDVSTVEDGSAKAKWKLTT